VEETAGGTIFLPLVARNYNPVAGLRTVNIPLVPDLIGPNPQPPPSWRIARLADMSIFWFGKITPSENYVDVRVAYTDSELVVYLAIIDRLIWYDLAPATNTLLNWDAVSVGLSLGGLVNAPDTTTFRFDLQYGGESGATHQAAFRGSGSGWTLASLPFTTFSSDRWESGPPNGATSKGWAAMMRIPFASLGISRPADGTVWGLSIFNRDRESPSNPTIIEKTWPETAERDVPKTWGRMRFGLPVYSAPGPVEGTTIIRQGLNGVVTPDGDVGGRAVCGGSVDYWTEWGETVNYRDSQFNEEYGDINIQNQADISDWPCFSKYYIIFPLTSLPQGKVIRSATLGMDHFGNSEPSQAQPSIIQVLTTASDFSETTLNWNNGPLALENVSRATIPVLPGFVGFPGVWRTWDISRAVALAYAAGQPLRLVLYSADAEMHSGKHFVSADTGDWNGTRRPTLTVNWGP
jgi:hypothetical protein